MKNELIFISGHVEFHSEIQYSLNLVPVVQKNMFSAL